MKCKHPNLVIIEYGKAITIHMRNARLSIRGTAWEHSSDFGDYTGILEVSCKDCGLEKKYGKHRPVWLQKYMTEFSEEGR